jgi:autotransporter-associated beta strand protein
MRPVPFARLLSYAALLALAAPAAAQTPTATWTATTSGTWSTGSRWNGGTAPPPGGGATQVLEFDNFVSSGGYTATNDRGSPFVLNGLIFSNSSASAITLDGSPLQFVAHGGTGPFVNQNATEPAVVNNDLQLAATLTVGGVSFGTLTFNGVLSGAGGLTHQGFGTLLLTNANTYTGVTTAAGNLVVGGASGSLLASTGYVVAPGGRLTLDNTLAVNGNRLADGTQLTLQGGAFTLVGNATAATAETVGTLNSLGTNTVTVTPGGSASTQLTAAGLTRTGRGTFLFDGTNLGGTPGPGVANLFLTSPPPFPAASSRSRRRTPAAARWSPTMPPLACGRWPPPTTPRSSTAGRPATSA